MARWLSLSVLMMGCAPSPSQQLAAYLDAGGVPAEVIDQAWSDWPMTEADAADAEEALHTALLAEWRVERAAELEDRLLDDGTFQMPLWWTTYGDAADGERSLYISMHGGGGTAAEVNDQQWSNQQQLYQPDEGVYVAPRAPTNEWNLWHRPEVDGFIDRLIEDMVALEGVDPDRVYLTGYSAGGDGAYQLAWHLADRFAAANPNAGHPNDSTPVGMRNLPLTVHMGGEDSAFNRNGVAAQWRDQLAELQANDPDGYVHEVVIHPGLPHWMNGEDAAAIPWMAAHTRNRSPRRVVWPVRGERSGGRLYWLGLDDPAAHTGALITATVAANTISIESDASLSGLMVWLDDALVDLDEAVVVQVNGQQVHNARIDRTIDAIVRSLTSDGAAFMPRRAVIEGLSTPE